MITHRKEKEGKRLAHGARHFYCRAIIYTLLVVCLLVASSFYSSTNLLNVTRAVFIVAMILIPVEAIIVLFKKMTGNS
jgi:ribose/xylose/arabinose/galactoside ABC-type transport system permease subunit